MKRQQSAATTGEYSGATTGTATRALDIVLTHDMKIFVSSHFATEACSASRSMVASSLGS